MTNLHTRYMGLELSSPLVVSACPLSEKVSNIVQMEDAGAGAVVMFSLFEEQIRQEAASFERMLEATSGTSAEAMDYFPALDVYPVGTENYLELIRAAKERVDIPVIASLNGTSDEGWADYAGQMESAGADGIEINVYYIPANLALSGEAVEQRYRDILRRVKASVSIPVAVKLGPYFSSMGNMAARLAQEGADALVLFNRFYQPDFDIQALKVVSSMERSSASEIRLPLLWLSFLYGRLGSSLAATTGVYSGTEVIKYLLAGADVTMTASSLLKHGIEHLETLTRELQTWMQTRGFESVDTFRGLLSQQNIADPSAFERANYIKVLKTA